MNIPFVDLNPIHNELKIDLENALNNVLTESIYISGKECIYFEKEYADYTGSKYAIGCGNGLDAIYIGLKVLGIGEGDEVIVPAHTFIATALAVSYTGAIPVFVDADMDTYHIDILKIENAITPKTKAIIPVHLYGSLVDVEKIKKIAEKHNLFIVEDAAQCHGATFDGKQAGFWGDMATYSFYPGKNLGALGDAGMITTNNVELAKQIRTFRNYGSNERYHHLLKGTNSRLDELQSAFLRIKLKHLDRWTNSRIEIAEKYRTEITNPKIKLPMVGKNQKHVFHIFPILVKNRKEFMEYLSENGIQSLIHYPIPIHLQEAYNDLTYKSGDFPIAEQVALQEVSIPIFVGLTMEKVDYIIEKINMF